MGWAVIVVAGILLFLWGYGDLVADSQKLAERAREMLHKERIAAMDKGLPAPDGNFDEALLTFLSENPRDTVNPARSAQRARGWAIALILGGLGWFLGAASVSPNSQIGWVYETAAFGFLPALLGVGLLLHSWLIRPRA